MKILRALTSSTIAALAIVGCNGDGTGPDDADTAALRAEAVGTFFVNTDAGAAFGLFMDPRTGTHSFTRSAPCPAGGSLTVSGSGTTTFDQATSIHTNTWSTTQTHDDCAVTHSRGDRSVTVTIDGSVTSTGSMSYRLSSDRGPRSLLAYTSRRQGSTTTTVGDRTSTCVIDVTQTYDPATATFTSTGTICGRDVSIRAPHR